MVCSEMETDAVVFHCRAVHRVSSRYGEGEFNVGRSFGQQRPRDPTSGTPPANEGGRGRGRLERPVKDELVTQPFYRPPPRTNTTTCICRLLHTATSDRTFASQDTTVGAGLAVLDKRTGSSLRSCACGQGVFLPNQPPIHIIRLDWLPACPRSIETSGHRATHCHHSSLRIIARRRSPCRPLFPAAARCPRRNST